MNIPVESLIAYGVYNPAIENRINRRVNTVGTITYVGYSINGLSEDEPLWFIQKIFDDDAGNIEMSFANNVTWTDRASATYL